MGIHKTFERINDRYYWPDSLRDVQKYIKACIHCQMKKDPLSKPAGYLQSIPVHGAFHTIGMDYLGPFTVSNRQNEYLIVAIDHLTKWIETRAVRAATAANAAKFFVEQIVLRHGAPIRLLTDRGQHFVATLMQHITILIGVEHVTTTSYHPQCNGLTERMNKTLAVAMSHYVNDTHKDWDLHVPFITFCINTSIQDTTQFSPFELVYGRKPTLPLDVSLGYNGFDLITDPKEYATLVHNWLTEARELALARTNIASQRRANTHNASRRLIEYQPGDLVLLWSPPKLHTVNPPETKKPTKLTTKLLHSWHGPFKILSRESDVNYTIQLVNGHRNKTDIVHVKRLKPHFELDQSDFLFPDSFVNLDSPEPIPEATIVTSDALPLFPIDEHTLEDVHLFSEPDDISITSDRPRRNIPTVDYSKLK